MKSSVFVVFCLVLLTASVAEARRRSYSYGSSSGSPNAAASVKSMPEFIRKEVDKTELNLIEENLLKETNKARQRHGLHPLQIDRRLQRQTRWHAIWMTRNRSMVHGSGVIENIAMGQRNTREVLGTWMNSSGHRANILNPSHTKAGLSAYRTPEGTVYWCQQFSR